MSDFCLRLQFILYALLDAQTVPPQLPALNVNQGPSWSTIQIAQDAQTDAQPALLTSTSAPIVLLVLHLINLTIFNSDVSFVIHHAKTAPALQGTAPNVEMEPNLLS